MSDRGAVRVEAGIDYRTVYPPDEGVLNYDRDFDLTIDRLVGALSHGATIAEYGAGANPQLATNPRVLAGDFDYLRIDVSASELAKSTAPGTPVVADVCAPGLLLPRPADFALSRMLAEHVPSGAAFLENVFRNLTPGGVYLQVSPVLFAIPFVANRLLPERIADRALAVVSPRDRDQFGKFPAPYSWCRGPSKRHLRRLASIGFVVDAARGYYGHTYYQRIPIARELERAKAAWLSSHPIPAACAFTIWVLSKPR